MAFFAIRVETRFLGVAVMVREQFRCMTENRPDRSDSVDSPHYLQESLCLGKVQFRGNVLVPPRYPGVHEFKLEGGR